mgnify:CR=1 FL=1
MRLAYSECPASSDASGDRWSGRGLLLDLRVLERIFEIVEAEDVDLVIADIQAACDLTLPQYQATAGDDGYVSLEVSPALSRDEAGTLAAARRLFAENGFAATTTAAVAQYTDNRADAATASKGHSASGMPNARSRRMLNSTSKPG